MSSTDDTTTPLEADDDGQPGDTVSPPMTPPPVAIRVTGDVEIGSGGLRAGSGIAISKVPLAECVKITSGQIGF